MKMLTSDGKIVEGQPLTEEEIKTRQELVEKIPRVPGIYLSGYQQPEKLANWLIQNFTIAPRTKQLEIVDNEPTIKDQSIEPEVTAA